MTLLNYPCNDVSHLGNDLCHHCWISYESDKDRSSRYAYDQAIQVLIFVCIMIIQSKSTISGVNLVCWLRWQPSVMYQLQLLLSRLKIWNFLVLIDNWLVINRKVDLQLGNDSSIALITYIFAWIALLSEQEHRSSTKPCKLAQMTLDELSNKIHEGFMLSKCQENVSIGLKP
jgi:hypothetical protein